VGRAADNFPNLFKEYERRDGEVLVARYRLRFLLQEFDLPRGVTLIGRSLDCQVTIEDPLVSRQHARIVIDGDHALLEDLGSRNGVKVNGVPVRAPMSLNDGDRLRIGTQELVFCRVEPIMTAHAKTTGVLRLCAHCRLPYPRELVACPNCEGTEQTEEDETLSGSFGADKQHSWGVQLIVEALEKALSLGRVQDAERIARRATLQFEEALASGRPFEAHHLAGIAQAAVTLALQTGDAAWGVWVVNAYRRIGRVPPTVVVERFVEVATRAPNAVKDALAQLVDRLQTARAVTDEDPAPLARLEELRRKLESPPPRVDGLWPLGIDKPRPGIS
jgi:hypothetical protein